VPLAEPQVPANPVTPQAPLPPAAVDGLLRHAQVGSQFLNREKPVRAAHGSRAAGSPVPDECTLTCGHVVKFAVGPGGGHGSLRSPEVQRFGMARATGLDSRAAAIGPVLVPPGEPAPVRAGEQHGLACRPGPAISSADSARDVKPRALAGSRPGRARRPGVPQAAGWRGWPPAGLPLSGPDAPHVRRWRPARGNGAGDGAASRRGRALRRSVGASSSAP
jgi:hypothetical protein